MSAVDDALGHLHKESLAALTREMIDIPSPVGGERALAEYLANRFRSIGLTVEMQEVEADRFNVLAVLPGTGGGPRLMFGGHLDTPYAGDEEGIRDFGDAFQPRARVEGDWIFGLSASNMKGGLASAAAAVEALARAKVRLAGDVMFAGFVGETLHEEVAHYRGARYRGTGIGAGAMVAKGRLLPDLAIFAIPTLNAISVASGGFVYSELKTRGLPGSPYRRGTAGAQPTPPTDAITRMFAAIPTLKAWGARYIAERRYRGQASAYVNLTAIEGGLPFRPSKLAAACRLYVDIGLMPGDDPADAIDGLRNCIAGIERADPDIGIEMNVVKVAEGAEVSTDEPIVAALSDAFRQSCHRDPEITWDGWCTDAGVFNRAGIPAVSYGAHGRTRSAEESFLKVGEHLNVDDLVRGAEVFVRAACTIAREQD